MNNAFRQQDIGIMRYPATSWHKFLFKAPLTLWRLGLGRLIGRVLMVITHTGRKSGQPRHTMVEYHMLNGEKYAPSAFGNRAEWYKNILVDSRVTIQTSHGTENVRAVRVTNDQELLEVYHLFMRRDPPLMRLYLRSLGIQEHPAELLAKKNRVYWIRFDPTGEPTPPPLAIDLVWVWPVLGITLIILLALRKFSISRTRRP